MKKILIIAPCYNEEEALTFFHEKVGGLLSTLIASDDIHPESGICFVDDGSADATWSMIESLIQKDQNVKGIKLSRNFGHQYALLAGLETYRDCYDGYLTIDVDLQDDIGVIPEMVTKLEEGDNIVYGVRTSRGRDSFWKKYTALLFYQIMRKLGANTVFNHADFRLIDNAVLGNFLKFKEYHMFLRGIFPMIGFKAGYVYYVRQDRVAGEPKYSIKKLTSLAWSGITSFSVRPLRLILVVGMFSFVASFLLGIWVIYRKVMGLSIEGWTSLMIVILFFSSINMLSIGLIGEYLGKIYQEIKGRPRYIIENISEGNRSTAQQKQERVYSSNS